MAIRTPLCERLGIDVPIVLAGMGQAATPALAAAVSNAGGLGVLGATGCSPDQLRRWIHETRTLTDRPFGVDTILPASVRRADAAPGRAQPSRELLAEHSSFATEFMDDHGLAPAATEAIARAMGVDLDPSGPPPLSQAFFDAQMEIVLDERVPVYAAGLGSPAPWMDRLRANGTFVISVVGSTRHVAGALAAGVDAIVAQGSDGGGHHAPVGTMALVPQVVDAAGATPVLAAGAIGDGRGLAAALMLGAQGVWVGTAFLAAQESGVPDYQKRALLDADASSTQVSAAVTGKPARFLRGAWTTAWEESGRTALPMPWQTMVAGPVMGAAAVAERADVNPGIAGQGVGLVHEIRPAAEIVRAMTVDAERCLRAANRFVTNQQ
jgi:NAD(P)H-dependent flavin oxidoreductase YrpB (nitropropane dioxygenase family)